MKKRTIYIGLFLIFIIGLISLIGTFAVDSTITEGNSSKADYLFNIVLGDRTNRDILIPSYDSKIVDIKISNPNEFNMSYLLYLEGINSNISIINISDTEANGILDSKNTNIIKVFIQNNSGTDITVSIKDLVGFEKETLSLPSNSTSINKGVYYKSIVKSNNNTYGKVKPNIKLSTSNGIVKYNIVPNTGYQYKSTTCEGTIVDNILTISNITSNISCEVIFEPILITVNFDGNIFSPSENSITSNGLTITYDPDTSYLTINGTPTATINIGSTLLKFTAEETYRTKLTYISGTAKNSGSGRGEFTTYIKKTDNSNVSTANFVDTHLANENSESTLTVNESGAAEGAKLTYGLWFATPTDWTFTNYKIKIDITKVENKTIQYGNKYETLPIPTRTGYTFAGWYTGENGTGTKVDENTILTNMSNHTLYAYWVKSIIILYDYIKNNADTTTTIDFSQTSEASNTNGIYTTTDTDSGNPVYYYRGSVDNHALFANFCWRIVRTTETGGVKLIYDGVPSNGQCNNTGNDTTIGNSAFNSTYNDAKYVGYMYGSSIDDTANTNDSTVKTVIDAWYKNNMTDYTSQLEDTVFCNDRSYTTSNSTLYFGARTRLDTNKTPTLKCQNTKDKFTVETSNGNGALTYPVGLITTDEGAYAGGVHIANNKSFYLYNGQLNWTLSPYRFTISSAYEFDLSSNGTLNSNDTNYSYGIRPVISLQPGTIISGGSGTATEPFLLSPPTPLYNRIKNNANIATTIDFSQTSETSNTNGIYMTTNTEGNVPVYYYRGNVDNHLIFANFCWRIIRTTETGGVKLIYDGVPSNGECNNTGEATTIGIQAFNLESNSPTYVGYMYGTSYEALNKDITTLSGSIVFGNDATYDSITNKYTLKDTYTLTSASNWAKEYITLLNKYHYTCFSSSTSCQNVNYIHLIHSTDITAYYFTLTNGKKPIDLLNDMFEGDINVKESNAKTQIDTWYKANMTNYTSQLEDTVFCNDRTYYNFDTSGWNKDYSNYDRYFNFSSVQRLSNSQVNLICSRQVDKFTVDTSNGNGALTYPVGLITADEIVYAGGTNNNSNSSFYLYNGITNWSISPATFDAWGASATSLISSGNYNYIAVYLARGLRPSVSLKKNTILLNGTGTSTDPYIVG